MLDHLAAGTAFVIPEVADYEVRRLLLQRRAAARLARLDDLGRVFLYHPITTAVMREAAGVWAEARQRGRPFTSGERLDGDAILCGHARVVAVAGPPVVVVTKDAGDLAAFVDARRWEDVPVP